MYLTVLKGYKEVAKELLNYRVDISTPDFKGRTVLYFTIYSYSLSVLTLLLDKGVDITT